MQWEGREEEYIVDTGHMEQKDDIDFSMKF